MLGAVFVEAYWDDRLAVMAPGGVDVYTVNPEFAWGKDEPWSMWQLEYGETFYRGGSKNGASDLTLAPTCLSLTKKMQPRVTKASEENLAV